MIPAKRAPLVAKEILVAEVAIEPGKVATRSHPWDPKTGPLLQLRVDPYEIRGYVRIEESVLNGIKRVTVRNGAPRSASARLVEMQAG
jgi:hypothetical protein